jgi:hypothetical protein
LGLGRDLERVARLPAFLGERSLTPALALWPVADAGDLANIVQTLAIVSSVALAVAIVGLPGSLAVVAGALATEAVLHAVATGLTAPAAIAEGLGLLVLCELLSWRTTLVRSSAVERSVVGRRLALLVLVSVAAVLAGLVVVAGSHV